MCRSRCRLCVLTCLDENFIAAVGLPLSAGAEPARRPIGEWACVPRRGAYRRVREENAKRPAVLAVRSLIHFRLLFSDLARR